MAGFVATYGGGLDRAFHDLFFDWYPTAEALTVEIQSRYGTSSRVQAGYPVDLNPVYAGARRHIENDTERDRLAERLETEAWIGQGAQPARHLPYILRWLVHPGATEVTFGDQADVEPVVRSPSVALIRAPGRRLKLWADGTAVLHFDRPSVTGSIPESNGMDLTRTSLREFQSLWRALETPPRREPLATPPETASAAEAAAFLLLREYCDGAWLQDHRLVTSPRPGLWGINWATANRLSTMHTEATLQDRAVLAIACHLSGQVDPLVSMPDALHYVGEARWDVMKALDSITGSHPDPQSGWPIDCATCP